MEALLLFVGGFTLGVFVLLGYILKRMMGNKDWDDSNITNALRLLSHVTLHPEDFGRMYYLKNSQYMAAYNYGELRRPFWYVDKDELSEVVKTRP